MLSATNTINDIKLKLRNDYAFFGFPDDPTFVAALTEAVENNKFEIMYPALGLASQSSTIGSTNFAPYGTNVNLLQSGKTRYDEIALKDKVDLTLFEEYVYWAEIWYSMSDFMITQSQDANFSITGSSETITTEGYSSTVSGTADESGKEDISSNYATKGNSYLVMAGLAINSMYRGGR